MNPVFLARLQFGLTAGFHFLFPPTTFGLTLLVLVFETRFVLKKHEIDKRISSFLVKVLGVVFVIGAATGISLEFAFGNNWSSYARAVGDIFGAPLAAEGIFSFFLESVFLGILLFGRRKVSPRTYWWSAFLVFFASHLSGLWIIIANSWMQTPAGFVLRDGRAVLTDFAQAALNPSLGPRFLHTVLGGWITGTLLAAGIGAWWLTKNKFREPALRLIKASLAVFGAAAILQLGSGHLHSLQVAKTQPEKMAAFEALWKTQKGAPFTVFGIPDEKNERTLLQVRIPKFLSYLIGFDVETVVRGLEEFPKADRPPVFVPFASYHLMILFGLILIGLGAYGLTRLSKNKHAPPRWFLKSLLLAIPLPYLANELGWISAEVGRQPWAVFHVLRTSDAASRVVPAGNILFSIIVFTAVYALIAVVGLRIILGLVRKGPAEAPLEGEARP